MKLSTELTQNLKKTAKVSFITWKSSSAVCSTLKIIMRANWKRVRLYSKSYHRIILHLPKSANWISRKSQAYSTHNAKSLPVLTSLEAWLLNQSAKQDGIGNLKMRTVLKETGMRLRLPFLFKTVILLPSKEKCTRQSHLKISTKS